MTGKTIFPVIALLVVGVTASFLVNLQRPLGGPVQVQPVATATRWAAPVLPTATASPTLTGAEGGWYSHMPTPVPVHPRVIRNGTPAPTDIATPIK